MEAALDLSPYVDRLDSAACQSLLSMRSARDPVPPDHMASISLWTPSTPVQSIDLAQCWQELASGRRQIADRSASDEYYFLLLASSPKPVRARRGIRARNFGVLNRVLLTPSRRQLSLEVGLSTSSIAALSKQCLELIGLSCTPCTAPPLLIMAASAAATPTSGKPGFSGERCEIAPGFELIRAPRPERKFATAFSRAEFDVAQRLLEGNSYAEIARQRQTSARTVANQVASIFHRTGVSSRSELTQRLLIDSTELTLTMGLPVQ